MGDLTENLSVREFACDCNYAECKSKLSAHMPLVLAIQSAADHFKREYRAERVRVTITDGNRCKPNNTDIQMEWAGKTREEAERSDSRHMYHISSDHRIEVLIEGHWKLVPIDILAAYYDYKHPDSYGIGRYSNRVHLDTRLSKARW